MKFYISEKTKKELVDEIAGLEAKIISLDNNFDYQNEEIHKEILTERLYVLKEILSKSIVLPIEDSKIVTFENNVAIIIEETEYDITIDYMDPDLGIVNATIGKETESFRRIKRNH